MKTPVHAMHDAGAAPAAVLAHFWRWAKMKLLTLIVVAAGLALFVLYFTPGSAPLRVDKSYARGLELAPRIYRDRDWSSRGASHIVSTLDALLSDLRAAGEDSPEETKIACFRRADEALQALLDRKVIDADDATKLFYDRQVLLSLAGLDPKKLAQGLR